MPGSQSYIPKNLAANATTLVYTGQGVLHGVVINTKGASSNTLKIYDGVSASGTLIATIDTTVVPGTFLYDLAFNIGLTIVIGTGTAADATVLWVSK